jgi:hypothetical protein
MQLSINENGFLDSFDHIESCVLDKHKKNKLELFVLKTNANEFDYKYLIQNLLDPVIDYSLSRKVRSEYANRPSSLSRKAREKFVDYLNNKGELGELILYCFLETHLKAPKILSKLELKTSTNMNIHGSDGVHFLKLDSGNYQLIFGESKTVQNLTSAFTDAFKSIYEFKNELNAKGDKKSGLPYEKGLVSDHLEKETFSEADKEFIKKIIYPRADSTFEIDDAFGIFIGYELTIDEDDKKLPNNEFREKIKRKIKNAIYQSFPHISTKIQEHKLHGHNFYIYVMPFTNLEETRQKIQQAITE